MVQGASSSTIWQHMDLELRPYGRGRCSCKAHPCCACCILHCIGSTDAFQLGAVPVLLPHGGCGCPALLSAVAPPAPSLSSSSVYSLEVPIVPDGEGVIREEMGQLWDQWQKHFPTPSKRSLLIWSGCFLCMPWFAHLIPHPLTWAKSRSARIPPRK